MPLSQEQWSRLEQAAQANHAQGYEWKGDEPDRIHVYLRDEEARGMWTRLVADEGTYGAHQREIAQFVFNGGRPYAHLESIPSFDEPVVTTRQEGALETGQEEFVRENWHALVERASTQGPDRDVR